MQRVPTRRKENLIPSPMLGSSSSAAAAMAPPPPKYEVFLSFRGVDTRNNIISHLYAELCRKNIETFKDDRSLETGDVISDELCNAIEESMIYVIVFSENYASSSWCLNELVNILDCKERYDQRHVIPVFYHVEPSTVRYQKGSYAKALVDHKKWFDDKVIQGWKDALNKVAGISGTSLNDTRPESWLVDGIVEDILRKLNRSNFSSTDHGLIGIEEHIAQIETLLQLNSAAVRIIGIWGMGGVGKTTLARALYDKLRFQFISRSLVENAQQEIDRDGTRRLRKKYLKKLGFSDERLKRAKVLLILDDLKSSSQVQELIGGRGNFGQGSRIIVTSRDMQVLQNAEADGTYEVKEMGSQNSLQLFSLRAFKQKNSVKVDAALVNKVLEYAQGVPLALDVLGRLLCGRPEKAWQSQLQKLEKSPHVEIFKALKLSYDGLDNEEKDIFLDIVCFFVGRLEDEALDLLDGCGFSADIGMDVLKDRGLISISEHHIVVHDLILEMGREIVRQECVNAPGKRSRLWKDQETYHVLRKNKGTDAIQCISLDMEILEDDLHLEISKNMPNLRMLILSESFRWVVPLFGTPKAIIPAFLGSLPDGLKVLSWDRFPLRSLPLDFCSENLVKLFMHNSQLEQLWEKDQGLPNLKRLDLSGSSKLIRIPDISKLPNIEEIILHGCKSLTQVHSSSFLSKLKCLWLTYCVNLRSLNLPSNILSRSSGLVGLYNCQRLEIFLIYGTEGDGGARENYNDERGLDEKYSTKLDVFRELVPSRHSHELCWLDLSTCGSLTSLPLDLCKLKLLRRHDLSCCRGFKKFPEIKETMENLAVLILDETAIQELPSSLDHLVGLEELSLRGCRELVTIPSSIGRLSKLCKLELARCESLETFPSSIFELKLKKLDLSDCSKLKTFPEISKPAESVSHIDLSYTRIKELPSSLDYLVGLQTLSLRYCRDLESLPNSIGNLSLLTKLDCSGCHKLTEIPNDIGHLSSLRNWFLLQTGIVNLPESIAHLSSLESLDVSYCEKLVCIPQLPPFIISLLAFDCPSITRVMPNSMLKHPSDSNAGTFGFRFILTSMEEQDPSAHRDVIADARLRINEDAFKFVFYCFPGSAVPDWFPHRCKGNSVPVDKKSLNNRLIGFAMCVVLPHNELEYDSLRCKLTFESDSCTHILPDNDLLNNYLIAIQSRTRHESQDNTIIWTYDLMDSASIDKGIFQAHQLKLEITNFSCKPTQWDADKYRVQNVMVKECGICPLYTKEKR